MPTSKLFARLWHGTAKSEITERGRIPVGHHGLGLAALPVDSLLVPANPQVHRRGAKPSIAFAPSGTSDMAARRSLT